MLDAGTTRSILDPLDGAIEQRDSKTAIVLTEFDEVHRPSRRWARDRRPDTPTLREVSVYGEHAGLNDPAGSNLLSRLYEAYDEAGRLRMPSYDFAGNLVDKRRRMLAPNLLMSRTPSGAGDWQNTAYQVDWQPAAGQTLDAHAETMLDANPFEITMTYDALRRPTSVQAPLDAAGHRQTLVPTYGPCGELVHLAVDGVTYVERLAHNARGQRQLCVLGNGLMTRYAYDPMTFRLARLRAEPCTATGPAGMPTGWRSTGAALQDHGYHAYDQAGNLWAMVDTTPGGGIGGQPNKLPRAFTYDALYQLTSASGREAIVPLAAKPWLDNPPAPANTNVRHYVESYAYDAVGNLLSLAHNPQTVAAGYTRRYDLAAGSNRLSGLVLGGTTYNYTYDAAGNTLTETTSRVFEWDHANRLSTYRTQPAANAEPSVCAQYRYDAAGRRVMKLVRRQGGQLEGTAYIDGLFERLVIGIGPGATHHDTLHVADGAARVALVRAGPAPPGDSTPPVTYQLGDHLGSSEVVLDKVGGFVRREEFLPYGETSLGGYAKKRYRFTAKERDEESSFYYHGARYYVPWLARWASTDPAGGADGPSLYVYVRSSPIGRADPTGRQSVTQGQLDRPTAREEAEKRSIPTEHPPQVAPKPKSIDDITAGELQQLMQSENPADVAAARRIFAEGAHVIPKNLRTEDDIATAQTLSALWMEVQAVIGVATDVYGGGGLTRPVVPTAPRVLAAGSSGGSSRTPPSGGSSRTPPPGGSDPVYIPRTKQGTPVPLPQRDVGGVDIPLPDPAAEGPHTVLGGRVGTGGQVYRQSATFPEAGNWPSAPDQQAVPFGRVDWTSHPDLPGHHPNPHVHPLSYDPVNKQWLELPPLPFPQR
jgi:RHS repeat-associated protein